MPVTTFHRALITGSSGGIGEAIARELAGRGTHLVLVARSTVRLEAHAADLREDLGIEVEVLTADLTTGEGLAEVEERLRRTDAPVDLLVNNAGVGSVGRFVDLDLEHEHRMVALNTTAPVRLTHAVLPGLLARGGGGIVNVSSMASFQPMPFMATYGGTKAFLTSFSQALHEELGPRGVTVTAVCPGFTRTDFTRAAGAESAESSIPATLWGSAGDVARAAVDGVSRGRAVIVPGGLNRITATTSSLTPSSITRRVTALGMRLGRR